MGYTHYYKTKKVTDEKFEKFSKMSEKLYENLPKKTNSAGGFFLDDNLEIAGSDGTGKPTFNNDIVSFNGKEELSHETFIVENVDNDEFCKTARKPYDLLVVACLIAAMQTIDLTFSSDGFNERKSHCDDLQSGIDFYNEVIKPKTLITQKTLFKQRKNF